MIRAKLKLSLPSRAVSKCLVDAVAPDNMRMPGLKIVGRAESRFAEFRMTFGGRIETFIFTLDDMLQCLQTAKKTLDSIARENME